MENRKPSVICSFFIIVCLLTGIPAQSRAKILFHGFSEVDVSQEWYQLESEHFVILFPLQLARLSEIIAEEAEEVFLNLTLWTGYTPGNKIPIILNNGSDVANGCVKFGTKGLFITLNTVYPYSSLSMSIDEYRNWYRNLLIHELSHYFHFDITRGLPKLMRTLLGNTVYPNAATPPFYREGFATYSETVNESGFGRGNSPYTHMFIRTAVLENNFTPLDRASNVTSIWPVGNNHYLFGVSFMNYLSDQYGEEKIVDFNTLCARYSFYTWGLAFRKEYEKSMHKMWKEWEGHVEEQQKAFYERTGNDATTTFHPISDKAGYVESLSFDSTGKRIAYSLNPPDRLGGLYKYDFESGSEKCMKKGVNAHNLVFSHDDTHLFYIRYDIERNVTIRNNIYKLDIEKKREKQITTSGRVQSFILLPEKDQILTCSSTPYGTELRLIDMDGNLIKLLSTGSPLNCRSYFTLPVIEEPALSRDSKVIAFSCKDNQGTRSIYTVPLRDFMDENFTMHRLTGPQYSAYSPCWISNRELLFIGDDEGTYNLYRAHLGTHSIRRISNVQTGVFHPDVSRDGKIAVKEYTSKGFRVAYTDMEIIDRHSEERKEMKNDSVPRVTGTDDSAAVHSVCSTDPEKYRPVQWLAPGYWLPVWSGGTVSLGIGLHTCGADWLKKHSYDLSIVYDIIDSLFKTEFNYTHRTCLFSYYTSLYLSHPLHTGSFSPDIALNPGTSYSILKRRYFLQANTGIIYEPPFFGPDIQFYFSNIETPPGWIGPERGLVLSQEFYFNSFNDTFSVIHSTFSCYCRPVDFLSLNLRIINKAGFGAVNGYVQSGNTSGYAFVPLNGVFTLGYPDPIPGKIVSDIKLTMGMPLVQINRGIHALPFFFKGIRLRWYSDNSIVVSDSSPYRFVITSADDFIQFPLQYIRSSMGAELQFAALIGYELPFDVTLGYVYPFSTTGRSGIYINSNIQIGF